MVIDPATEKGGRVDARLREELVAWLVTVAEDGTPVPTPVWFWWDGETLLVYSQRDKPKLRHTAANPRVALAMRTDEHGDALVVITGEAGVDDSAPPPDQVPEYIESTDDIRPESASVLPHAPALVLDLAELAARPSSLAGRPIARSSGV